MAAEQQNRKAYRYVISLLGDNSYSLLVLVKTVSNCKFLFCKEKRSKRFSMHKCHIALNAHVIIVRISFFGNKKSLGKHQFSGRTYFTTYNFSTFLYYVITHHLHLMWNISVFYLSSHVQCDIVYNFQL